MGKQTRYEIGRYGKFKETRSFGKAGNFDLDLITSHLHVLEQEKNKRIRQGYYVRVISDKDTDFWRLYIQKIK